MADQLTECKYKIYLMRLSHRTERDKRASTHLLLAARALGVHKSVYTGQKDKRLEHSVDKVRDRWGGYFEAKYERSWKRFARKWSKEGGEIIHLTMYGLPIQEVIHFIRKSQKKKLIVVGGSKVPGEIYKMADYNVSITSQPHSEISALSIFLHELFQGRELVQATFKDAKTIIAPRPNGKKVLKNET